MLQSIERPITLTTEQVLGYLVPRPIKMAAVQQQMAERLADIGNVSSFRFIKNGYEVRLYPHPSRQYPQAQYDQDMLHPDVVSLEQQQEFMGLPASFLVEA